MVKLWQEFPERAMKEDRENLQYSLQDHIWPKAARYKDHLRDISTMLGFAVGNPERNLSSAPLMPYQCGL
jgi:hypothetical protein